MRKLVFYFFSLAIALMLPLYSYAQAPEKTRWVPKEKQVENMLSKKAQDEKLAKEAEKRKAEALLQEKERMQRAKKSSDVDSQAVKPASVEQKAQPSAAKTEPATKIQQEKKSPAAEAPKVETPVKGDAETDKIKQKSEPKAPASKTRLTSGSEKNEPSSDGDKKTSADKMSAGSAAEKKSDIKTESTTRPMSPQQAKDNKDGTALTSSEKKEEQQQTVEKSPSDKTATTASPETATSSRRYSQFLLDLPNSWKVDQRPAAPDSNNIVFKSPGERNVLLISVTPSEFPGRAAAEAKQNAYLYKDHVAGITKVDYVASGAYRLETVSGDTTIFYGNIGGSKVISIQLVGRETPEVKAILSSIK